MTDNPLPFVFFGWVSLCGAIFILAWIVALFRIAELSSYMRKKHNETYLKLSGGTVFGMVLSNPGDWIPYLLDKTPTKDNQLTEFKGKAGKSIRFALIWAALLVVSILVVIEGMVLSEGL
jgi:multidrug efflux pump subunit AcrB